MLRRNLALLAALTIAVAAGCASEGVSDLKSTRLAKNGGSTATDDDTTGSDTSTDVDPTVAATGTSKTKRTPLPDLRPVPGRRLSSPRQVLTSGAFTATQPTVRANDLHATPVTGKDCMTCHGTGGSAPHFAYGGTIALGKKWVVGTPAWTKGAASAPPNEYADEYGDYGSDDDYGYDDDDDYGYCPDSDYDDYSDYGSYDDYEDDDYGYDDDDDYGGSRCGKRGWPEDRTAPSTRTGVRIVGDDGNVFDAVTDEDGNFWFKSKEDVAVPAFTGIEYGTFRVTGSTNGVACGSCHESGAADSPGRIWTWNGPTPR